MRRRGAGTVEPLPSGSYRATRQREGKRERRTFPSEREALCWLAEGAVGVPAGVADTLTLGDWFQCYISDESLSPATRFHWPYHWRTKVEPWLGSIRLADFSVRDYQQWRQEVAHYSPVEVYRLVALLSAVVGSAVEKGKLAVRPVADWDLPKVPSKVRRTLSVEEARLFLQCCESDRFGSLFAFMLDTGCRPGEALGMHWQELDLSAGVARIRYTVEQLNTQRRLKETKTRGSNRSVVLSSRTVEVLTRLGRRSEGLVWATRKGEPQFRQVVGEALAKVLSAGKLPKLSLYSLRHSCATLLLGAGINVKIVSERLGHSSIETTLRFYFHSLPGMGKVAADWIGGTLYPQEPR